MSLGVACSATACRIVCARCAAVQGEGGALAEEAEDNVKEGSGGAGEWRSWIETLLLKHPEEKVREDFQGLLMAAVSACRASADAGPACVPSAAGKQGAGVSRATIRRKATPMSAGQGACAAAGALKVQECRVCCVPRSESLLNVTIPQTAFVTWSEFLRRYL